MGSNFTLYSLSRTALKRLGDEGTGRRGDWATRGLGDEGIERRGDWATRGLGDKGTGRLKVVFHASNTSKNSGGLGYFGC